MFNSIKIKNNSLFMHYRHHYKYHYSITLHTFSFSSTLYYNMVITIYNVGISMHDVLYIINEIFRYAFV